MSPQDLDDLADKLTARDWCALITQSHPVELSEDEWRHLIDLGLCDVDGETTPLFDELSAHVDEREAS